MTLLAYGYAVIANAVTGACLAALSIAFGYLVASPETARLRLASLPADRWNRLCTVGQSVFTWQAASTLALLAFPFPLRFLSPWDRLGLLLFLLPGPVYLAVQWRRARRKSPTAHG